ncbi:MAG: 4Fe-4S dicluster domain-containing protein [Thermodesulfobacteriota bacterium]|nr:4Fe-4S dicluster domain-containing protein [Thermodesulfobacteriota bacterium]
MITIDSELRRKILENNEDIKRCYQCFTCSASCPVMRYDPDFNPRLLIVKALYGSKEILESEEFWKCLSCNRCNERCPQGVNPYLVLVRLKNLLFSLNLAPKERIKARELIINTGLAYPLSKAINRKRNELGLTEIEPIDEQLHSIVKA